MFNTIHRSHDKFRAKLKQSEYTKDFIELWTSTLKDDLSDKTIVPTVNKQNIFNIETEQLFEHIECGDQVEAFLIQFLRKHPDSELECVYESTYNYCSSMNIKFITYFNGIICVHSIHSESPYIKECPTCKTAINNISLYDFKETNYQICPECKSKIYMTINVDNYDIDVKTGKYSFEDDEAKFEDIY